MKHDFRMTSEDHGLDIRIPTYVIPLAHSRSLTHKQSGVQRSGAEWSGAAYSRSLTHARLRAEQRAAERSGTECCGASE